MAIGIEDIEQTLFSKYYKIHDKDRGTWYYSEWLIGVLVNWALDINGYDYEKWK